MKLHCNEEKYDDDVINVAELDIANSFLRRELNLRGNCLPVVTDMRFGKPFIS